MEMTKKEDMFFWTSWDHQTLNLFATISSPEKHETKLKSNYLLWPVVTSKLTETIKLGINILAYTTQQASVKNSLFGLEWRGAVELSPDKPHACVSTLGVPLSVDFVPSSTSSKARLVVRIFSVEDFFVGDNSSTIKECKPKSKRADTGHITPTNCSFKYSCIFYTVLTFNIADQYCMNYKQNNFVLESVIQ